MIRVYRGICAANKCIHARGHDAARIAANHMKSNLTARTDIDMIAENDVKFNIYKKSPRYGAYPYLGAQFLPLEGAAQFLLRFSYCDAPALKGWFLLYFQFKPEIGTFVFGIFYTELCLMQN